MAVTTNLRLPLLEVGQLGKESTVNQDQQYLDDLVGGYRSLTLSGTDYTLSALEARSCVLELTGSLSGDVLFPAREQVHVLFNSMGSAVTCRPTGGTGVVVPAGGRMLTYSTGTVMVNGVPSTLPDGDYGDITVSGDGTVMTIDPEAVTYAKMQDVTAASRLLGRGDSGSGNVQELSLGTGLTMTGTTLTADITGASLDPLVLVDSAPPAAAGNSVILSADDTNGAAGTAGLLVTTEDGTTHILGDRVGLGLTSGLTSMLHVRGNDGQRGDFTTESYHSGNTGPTWKARYAHGTLASPTYVVDNDIIMHLDAEAWCRDAGNTTDGFLNLASIRLRVDSVDAQSRIGGRIDFLVSPGVSAALATHMRLDETGDLTLFNGGLITDDVRLQGATSGTLTLTPAATTTSYSLTWPAAQGGASTVLTNNGSGTLSWDTPAGGVSDGDKGDIIVSGSGATWTIDAGVVTYAKLQDVSATSRFLGRITAGAGDAEELTGTQATSLLTDVVGDSGSGGTKGLVPAPAAGDAAASKFLKADGTWAAVSASLSGGAANKIAYWTSSSALSNDTDLHWDATNNNLGLGTATFGTSLKQGIGLFYDSTNVPTTNVTDVVQLYAADQAAGRTSLWVRDEGGITASIGGKILVNTPLLSPAIVDGGMQLNGAGALLQLANTGGITHGVTSLVNTGVYLDIRPIANNTGGVQIRGFTEGAHGVTLSSVTVTDPSSSKDTTAGAATVFEFAKKASTTVSGMTSGVNLVAFSDAFVTGNKWILDMDGDTWQPGDVGAATMTLTGVAIYKRNIEATTAGSGAPNVLVGASENLKILTNEGATARNYHTLPSAVAGWQFTFVSQDSDLMRVTAAAGDTIRVGANVSAAAGYIENGAQGDAITLVAINATEWVAIAAIGTWTPT